ncbi:ATP-binding protein [Clostridium sp.]|uniref:sensor histidine kinase n=1 Tax=Clostridium sp. TaxID=1506 RepID=UPI00283CC485|nr:ATP-binding protein [Clostridium sp.]MDR3594778.1 ATP-binding protein [Clostridium sp.]
MKIKTVFKNMTISRRFTASALIVFIITTLFFEVQGIIVLVGVTNNNISQKVETTSKLVGLSFADPIWNLNEVSIRETSDALFQDNEIAYIRVESNSAGEIYTKYKTGQIYEDKNLLMKTVDVLKDNMTIGEVTIGITNYYSIEKLHICIIITIMRILMIFFILWLAINFVSRIVTRSIYELSMGTDEIASGNLTHRLSINTGDEIGELASKFNNMAKNLHNMIQERDNAISALRASEEKFNKAFNYSADVIGILRLKDKLYVEINDAFLRIFSYTREEIIGHYSLEFNLWENEEQHLNVIELLDNGELLRSEEVNWRNKYGEIRVGLFSTEVIEIAGIPCIIFVWTDITERKKADEALKRANDQLENKVNERTKQLLKTLMTLEKQHEKLKSTQAKLVHSEKMASLGTLVAGVAHEINNPINYSYLSSKMLQKDFDDFKEKLMFLLDGTDEDVINFFEEYFNRFSHSINSILDGSNQIKSIVQDLRLFSRMDKAIKDEMYISEALKTTIRLVKTQYTKQIEFITDFHTDGKIVCYPSQLKQVFLNIIVNACQAITQRQNDLKDEFMGLINISLLDNHKEIIIVFSDNGCGMTNEAKSRMFEPFFTTKPVGEGTGLGMAISYGIIEEHNGKIDVKSEEGKGSTIKVYLPYDKNLTQ